MPITIFLDSASFQGNFDNVRLSDSIPVPEPTATLPFGLALLAGFRAFARRTSRPTKGARN